MKAPEFWKTYLGIALAGGLVAYVFLVEMKKEDKPEKTKEKVLTLDKAKVKAELGSLGVKNIRDDGPRSLHIDDVYGYDVQISGLESNALSDGG